MDKYTVAALIPARGGSKGVKKKNIRHLNGKPLIAYTVEAAVKSGIFDRIIVSTDSEEIASTARQYGAEAPFLRPAELASDTARAMDTYIHAINWLRENDRKSYDYLMVLLPTTPLRSSEDIRSAYELIIHKKGNAVLSVCEMDHPPFWSNTIGEDLKIENFISEDIKRKNRQELPTYYRLNGAIYLAKTGYILEYGDWFKKDCFAYIMPKDRSVDIDSEFDFRICELLMSLTDKQH